MGCKNLEQLNKIDLDQLNSMLEKATSSDPCLYAIECVSDDFHDYAPDTLVYRVLTLHIESVIINPDGTLMFEFDRDIMDEVHLHDTYDECKEQIKNYENVKSFFETEDGEIFGFNKTDKQMQYEIQWVEDGKSFDDEEFDESKLD